MTRYRFQVVAVSLLLCLWAQFRLSSCRAQGGGNRGIEIASIDTQTRWAFRALSPVTVSSPIIRLGDVVKPLDPNMAGWQRLRRSLIGLVPIGGHPMTIQRHRLAQAIHDAEATPRAIDWIGPTAIEVVYREASSAVSGDSPAVAQVAYARNGQSPVPTDIVSPLSALEAERILHWILLAIDRQYPSIAETYQIDIDRHQSRLVGLRSMAGVTSVEFHDPIRPGAGRFHVLARSVMGPLESDVVAVVTLHPTVVVARKNLSRGHRIEAGDLIVKPLPEEEMEPGFVIDPDEAIGMEVRGAVRADRPIVRSDLGSPILVHRGDLIEIRVVGGGITITTNAKALDEGAASELVEIETMQPRKRLVARVVRPGLVEIVTRAPRVNP